MDARNPRPTMTPEALAARERDLAAMRARRAAGPRRPSAADVLATYAPANDRRAR